MHEYLAPGVEIAQLQLEGVIANSKSPYIGEDVKFLDYDNAYEMRETLPGKDILIF
jgi:hypothetical protein